MKETLIEADRTQPRWWAHALTQGTKMVPPKKSQGTKKDESTPSSVHGRPYTETASGPRFRPCAPHSVLARLGDKWTILVMSHLAVAPGHRLRFTVLKAGIEGITQRMLTLTLRSLERDGLLHRYQYAEVPARVEYELTDMGASMLPALEGFTSWIRENWEGIEGSRRDYDGEQGR